MINIDSHIEVLGSASSRVKATFFYRIIKTCGPALCRTIIKYAGWRLDEINNTVKEPVNLTNEIMKTYNFTPPLTDKSMNVLQSWALKGDEVL